MMERRCFLREFKGTSFSVANTTLANKRTLAEQGGGPESLSGLAVSLNMRYLHPALVSVSFTRFLVETVTVSFCLRRRCTAHLKVNDSQMPRRGRFWDEELRGVKVRRVGPVELSGLVRAPRTTGGARGSPELFGSFNIIKTFLAVLLLSSCSRPWRASPVCLFPFSKIFERQEKQQIKENKHGEEKCKNEFMQAARREGTSCAEPGRNKSPIDRRRPRLAATLAYLQQFGYYGYEMSSDFTYRLQSGAQPARSCQRTDDGVGIGLGTGFTAASQRRKNPEVWSLETRTVQYRNSHAARAIPHL